MVHRARLMVIISMVLGAKIVIRRLDITIHIGHMLVVMAVKIMEIHYSTPL
jgi:hypothetical protein